ncbi:MAG: MBL fold metallo-hydrolase [Pseudomonadales bacterium]|nr:MBL fold metallo-hydrolase [Pseudomonadales bacterium]
MESGGWRSKGTRLGGVGLVALALTGFDQARAMMERRIDFDPSSRAPGVFPETWIHGSESAMDNDDPPVQIHAYNEHTVILRENKAINYEGAFMYLFFGNGKVLLVDQGSTSSPALFPLREIVDEVIRDWAEAQGVAEPHLIVANSHLHGDHYAAWNQFVDRPNTTLVGLTHEEMMDFWGFENFPSERIEFDLGGRRFLVTGSPGHQGSEISFYDTYTDLLYTGDMFYRGRLYLDDWEAWSASIRRLGRIADEYPVAHLVNNHIEMTTTPGVDYPVGTTWQPDEPPMQMTREMLDVAIEATRTIDRPGIYVYDDFLIYNEIPWSTTTDP